MTNSQSAQKYTKLIKINKSKRTKYFKSDVQYQYTDARFVF